MNQTEECPNPNLFNIENNLEYNKINQIKNNNIYNQISLTKNNKNKRSLSYNISDQHNNEFTERIKSYKR